MLQPLSGRVVVEPQEVEQNKSGIVLITDAKPEYQQGIILAVDEKSSLGLSIGDTILFSQFTGTPVYDDGKKVVILKEHDILAIKK